MVFSLLYRLKSYGVKKNFIHGPAIIAVNHNSFLDPVVVHLCVQECLYHLARTSLFNHPITDWIWRKWACYPICKNEGNAVAFKITAQLLKEGKKVVIYPEGTRSPDGELQPGKSGMGMMTIKNYVPVIPVYIGGTYEAFNRYQKLPKIWRTITCIFGTPLYFDDLIQDKTLKNKEAYQIATNRIMAKLAELKIWYEAGCQGNVP
ncbi:1-acyl-sn-glycerol-3-phosphate acyltransferase [Candidatus Chlamydia sanziniae]|uniref:1-acyl-sn-glycerol-3-phosphate acyltransferase n=1 Tax=Candidatus Chlamydia sanziniae TaxID=1806891 RepID=A0A1A9HUI0_9CHLA|nr:1-acyl-sn-glycerol-3-phosphate acyltransferase [Candidatus Chlamydia sanziniae]